MIRLTLMCSPLLLAVACGGPKPAPTPAPKGDTAPVEKPPEADDRVEPEEEETQTAEADPSPRSIAPPEPGGPCADFNRQRKEALSPEEHMRQFGCPPCPCACDSNTGEIRCAPCAACRAVGPRLDDTKLPSPAASP